MKIYNEVVTIFNETTGLWETISEDSYEHNGQMILMQGSLPNNATAISAQDTIADTVKTTTGYFTNGDGTLGTADIYTGSLVTKNENYYFNVTQVAPTDTAAEVQFSVAFGHIHGSGSDQMGDTRGTTNNPSNIFGETKAIYKQLTNLLLEETEASGGFKICQAGSDRAGSTIASGAPDEYVYVLVGRRARFKDRINKKSWTIILSGSNTANVGVDKISLTDDSADVAAVSTPAGPRHTIISGALGVAASGQGAHVKSYGWFYPEMGLMLFSGAQLSASIPGPGPNTAGTGGIQNITSSFNYARTDAAYISSSGFTPNLFNGGNPKNALKFINCLRRADGNAIRLRSEEDQSQENFFCRIRANQYNFSTNPTFVSGSYNKIRNLDMHGNPTTFITGVGLYNSAGQLLAVAKLSSPLKKNFASEATIKVKLTY